MSLSWQRAASEDLVFPGTWQRRDYPTREEMRRQERVLRSIKYRQPCSGGDQCPCRQNGTWLDGQQTRERIEARRGGPVYLCKKHAYQAYPDTVPGPSSTQRRWF